MKKWKKLRKGLAVFLAGVTLLSPMSVAAENIFTGGSGIEGTMDSTEPGADDGSGRSADEQNPAVTPGGSKESQPGTDSEGEEGKIPGGQESPESDPPKTEDDPTLNSQEPELEGQQDEPDLQENVTPQEGLVPSDGSLVGETVKFVNLYWETDDLGDLEAVFDGGMDEDLVQTFTKSDRGVYETVIPAGDYSRISFRRAGSDTPIIRGVYNYYGVDMADASTETVAFIPQVNNTYYYDMGENPSYWGADPDYEVTDPEVPVTVLKEEPQVQPVSLAEDNVQSEDVTPGDPATDGNTPGEPGAEGGESGNPVPELPEPEIVPVTAPKTEQENPESGNPKPGQMIYAIDLDQRENYLVRQPTTTYRVNIGFLVEGHNDINSWETDIIATGQGEMYTMYEREPGLYTAPFPARAEKTTDNDVMNLSQKYYSEIAFSLQDKDGTPSEQNKTSRHFNFRGHEPTTEAEKAKFGHFSYYSGYTDTYYMNSNQDDSYWGAHPSRADQSLDTQVLYVNVEDYTENHIIADLDDMWMSWNGMPQGAEGDENFDPVKGWKITKTLPHENIRYFQFPKNSGATENTILTIHFKLKALEGTLTDKQKNTEYTYKFTLVPRSERNRLNMDYIWEFNGQIWDHFQAGGELETRSIFFENLRTQYEDVWMRVAKEDGSYADKEDIELWNLPSEEEKNEWVRSHVEEFTDDAGNVTSTWFKMDKVSNPQEYDKEKLFRLDIPGDYTKVQFRGIAEDKKIYYSNASTITEESAYPCYYAYQTGSSSDAVPEDDMETPGITGYWTSVYSVNTVGDESIDIPTGNIEWEEGVYYADSTFYDYYSDWEMTGRKITEWNTTEDAIWKPQAKNINTALDEYYQDAVEDPKSSKLRAFYMSGDAWKDDSISMITGEKLWNRNVKQQNEWTKKDGGPRYDIVADHLSSEGNLLLNEEIGDAMQDTDVELPLFKEDFLRGNNNLDTAVGNVYKNVKFPIHADMDSASDTYGYWVYNSARESDAFRLTYDVDEGYFLRRTGEGIGFRGKYAFFPFNDRADFPNTGNSMSIESERSRANYMFGSKMEFPFAMTESGYVYDLRGKEQDITFEFQGDDDVWIFIDGIMAVDLGGIHDAVRGTINLTKGTWEVRKGLVKGNTFDGEGTVDQSGKLPQELLKKLEDRSQTHTLTMFYMERGLVESNMKLTFNFPRTNRFIVEKEVDVDSTRKEGEEDIFADLLDHMGGFNFNIKNLVTSGTTLPVENSAGYNRPSDSTILFSSAMDLPVDADFEVKPDAGEVTKQDDGSYHIKQTAQITEDEPTEEKLLKITPQEVFLSVNIKERDYLRLTMKNLGTDDRTAQKLYLSFEDKSGKRVGGYAGNLGYKGEANTFVANDESILRIDYRAMKGDDDFDWSNIECMLIGIRNVNETDVAAYEISHIGFYKKMEEKKNIGFYVDDTQISDYGSYASGVLTPVDRAWYVKQTQKEDGSYDTGISWNTESGTFNLADGQRAVFSDKFRTGSYIALNENRNPKIFDTEWTIREKGEEIPARYLLDTRPDITSIENPLHGIAEEYPLSGVEGTEVYDNRKEIVQEGWNAENFQAPGENEALVYRSYRDPDSSSNMGTDLSVAVRNTLRRGSLTIKKQLTDDSADENGKYKPAEFTFKIYYTDIAGRGLEKQLDPVNKEQRYLVQTVTVHTNEDGKGETTIYNIPAGTKYYVVEVPFNGTKLEKIEIIQQEDIPTDKRHEGVTIKGIIPGESDGSTDDDYKNAYVEGTAYASNQELTFTNKIEPFWMDIEKIWKDGLTDEERAELGIAEVHIQLQRRIYGQQDAQWEVVTKDYFDKDLSDLEGNYVVLNKDNDWKTSSKSKLPAFNEKGERYEYQIVELNHQDVLQRYEVTYDAVYTENSDKLEGLHITYQAINTPAELIVEKKWDEGIEDRMKPLKIRAKLEVSDTYSPEAQEPQTEAGWKCYKSLSDPNHTCGDQEECYIELNSSTGWRTSIKNLPGKNTDERPYYYRLNAEQIYVDNNWIDVTTESSGYTASYGEPVKIGGGKAAVVSVTNHLNMGRIEIIKKDDQNKLLEGAEFKIERVKKVDETSQSEWETDPDWTAKTAVTNKDGTLVFEQLLSGTYRITETKAPKGYLLDPEGLIITIPCKNGELDAGSEDVDVTVTDKTGMQIVLRVPNAKLYQLPSTGGPGIYRYMITGILLMVAAVFILYKRRDEEVLRR